MARIIKARMCAEVEGPFVVFLIGMRLNKPWKIAKTLPVLMAMPRMIAELQRKPELGLLHARYHFGLPELLVVQYWRSFELLEAYSRSDAQAHLPAWQAFNAAVGSNGDVGIWHETYLIQPGQYENVYNNMPAYGLGAAGTLVEAKGGRQAARMRLKAAKGE